MPSESHLREIFDSLGDGLFIASPEGQYLEVNPAGCRMMRCSLDEMRSRNLRDLLDPSEFPRLEPAMEAMADGKVHRSEWQFLRCDGSRFVGELVGGRLPDGRYQSVVRDVTEHIEHGMREEILRHEATHRTKNVLSVVQSIARQTKGETRDDFLEIFEQRIASLAITHDLITAASWQPVELGTLVRDQLTAIAGETAGRTAIAGPELTVVPQAAQALGLAFHELATNAAKYGALSNAEGRVAVGWSVTGETPRLTLMWRESGGPAVSAPRRRGFGSKLVGDITGRSLKGESRLDYPASGLIWTLDCPLDEIVE